MKLIKNLPSINKQLYTNFPTNQTFKHSLSINHKLLSNQLLHFRFFFLPYILRRIKHDRPKIKRIPNQRPKKPRQPNKGPFRSPPEAKTNNYRLIIIFSLLQQGLAINIMHLFRLFIILCKTRFPINRESFNKK